ncbi:MAG TPA: DUF637 domain-containing protein [Methylibium sp.]|uniref:DUF637 domain-containing protein n=1 Tax=Methylibium sp. TaxID=2067992 RepID=UPI002DB5D51D|nr:DUF637 domain-containing protein [Methylibium sp.]HEU4458234.1 DUF637 domain-containing protein [Methylibium sp.]
MDNQGNLARTLDDLGSRENVRALVVSMLGAGIASGLTEALNLPRGQQLAGASFGTQFQSSPGAVGDAAARSPTIVLP